MSNADQVLPFGRVLRYNFAERLNHWIAAGSYIYLLLTGLAFWSPWLFWIALALGGGQTSRTLHPWAPLAMISSNTAARRSYLARKGLTNIKTLLDETPHPQRFAPGV